MMNIVGLVFPEFMVCRKKRQQSGWLCQSLYQGSEYSESCSCPGGFVLLGTFTGNDPEFVVYPHR
eukprot:3233522-Amphidinium_carterae.1